MDRNVTNIIIKLYDCCQVLDLRFTFAIRWLRCPSTRSPRKSALPRTGNSGIFAEVSEMAPQSDTYLQYIPRYSKM